MDTLRVELWNNGSTLPAAWSGRGQEVEWIITKPTIWSVAFSHPEVYECFCVQHFNSLAARKQFIKEVRDEF